MQRRIEKNSKLAKSGNKEAKAEESLMNRIVVHLEEGKPVRTLELEEDEEKLVKSYFLLTSKPVLYAANVSEDDLMSGTLKMNLLKRLKICKSGKFRSNNFMCKT